MPFSIHPHRDPKFPTKFRLALKANARPTACWTIRHKGHRILVGAPAQDTATSDEELYLYVANSHLQER
jgi:hypothetical protein